MTLGNGRQKPATQWGTSAEANFINSIQGES
jgi:hypothetical protein